MIKSYFYHILYNMPDKHHQQYAYGLLECGPHDDIIAEVMSKLPTGATNNQITALNEV